MQNSCTTRVMNTQLVGGPNYETFSKTFTCLTGSTHDARILDNNNITIQFKNMILMVFYWETMATHA